METLQNQHVILTCKPIIKIFMFLKVLCLEDRTVNTGYEKLSRVLLFPVQ